MLRAVEAQHAAPGSLCEGTGSPQWEAEGSLPMLSWKPGRLSPPEWGRGGSSFVLCLAPGSVFSFFYLSFQTLPLK